MKSSSFPNSHTYPIEDIAIKFLESINSIGISSMSKANIEVLLVHCYEEHLTKKEAGVRPTDFELSVLFKMPVSKIRRIRHAATLQFTVNIQLEAQIRFLNTLDKVNPDLHSDRVRILFEDPLAKSWFQKQITSIGGLHDTSFNRDLVVVPLDILKEVLLRLETSELTGRDKSTIERVLKNIISCQTIGDIVKVLRGIKNLLY